MQKGDLIEVACKRLGLTAKVHKTASAKAAEKQLRQTLDSGMALVAVDQVDLPYHGLSRELSGMMPYTVAVAIENGEPLVYDLAPEPFRISWQAVSQARARIRSAKHRMLVVDPAAQVADVKAAALEGIRATCRGLLQPPMKWFGLGALRNWADLIANTKDKKGWSKLFRRRERLYTGLKWMFYWIEIGTGSGNFRAMYARFLDEAAGAIALPALRGVAAEYRRLAGQWTALADAALPDTIAPLGRTRHLLRRKQRLVQQKGAGAASDVERITAELSALDHDGLRALPDTEPLFAEIRERVMSIADGEERAVTSLRSSPTPAAERAQPHRRAALSGRAAALAGSTGRPGPDLTRAAETRRAGARAA